MSKPAARLTDMHTCPMVTGVVPHVGGPIAAPGAPTVLIGGMPAAVVGDMCVCTGPPDSIILGSFSVLICGKPAARMGDMTAHGGVIILGCPTVLIGDGGGGGGGGGAAGGGGMGMSAANAAAATNSQALSNAAQNGDETADRQDASDFTAQFTLIDEAGNGVNNMRYHIRTPDGTIHEGRTDSSGNTETISEHTTSECTCTFLGRG